MPAKLIHWNTSTSGIRPTPSAMTQGQWAQQCADGGAYIKKVDGTVFEVRQMRTFTTFTSSFTLTAAHIFGYLRCASNSMTVTVPPGLMNPGEYLLIRYLPGVLTTLTIAAGSGVSINGTLTSTSYSVLRLQCYGSNNYDV
jgi:hypothetical protein